MRIAASLFSYPRMEFPFIADWLEYYLAMGIDRVYIGMHVNAFQNDSIVWAKKPVTAIYHPELKEEEVLLRFLKAVEPFRNAVVLMWYNRDADKGREGAHRESQVRFYNDVRRLIQYDYDWCVVADTDEFMVPQIHKDLRQLLLSSYVARRQWWVSEWKIEQKSFARRWDADFHHISPFRITRCEPCSKKTGQKFVYKPRLTKHVDIHYTLARWHSTARWLPSELCVKHHYHAHDEPPWENFRGFHKKSCTSANDSLFHKYQELKRRQ